MALQPPPTWALPSEVDEKTGRARFSPVWLKWFLDLAASVGASITLTGDVSGSGSSSISVTVTQARGLRETSGPTTLAMGAVADGEFLRRSGATIDGEALATIASGVWTATPTNVANLDTSTSYQGHYIRIGSVVVASGRVDVDPTAPGVQTKLGLSLPIASNIVTPQECAGVAFASAIAGQGAAILGDATNNRAEMNWIAGDITNQPMFYVFGYQII